MKKQRGPAEFGPLWLANIKGLPIAVAAAHVYSTFGQNWAEIMAFGRISGRNAAVEEPWA